MAEIREIVQIFIDDCKEELSSNERRLKEVKQKIRTQNKVINVVDENIKDEIIKVNEEYKSEIDNLNDEIKLLKKVVGRLETILNK